ncbi:MAG: C10 family peptidase [Phycisphaerales bacterium]
MRYRTAIFVVSMIVLQLCGSLYASPVTEQDARMVVTGWLRADSEPMGATLGRDVSRVETFSNGDGEPVYYIVYLDPSGFVIVSADDLVEPIIGFVEDGVYDPSDENPLGALATRDLNGRIAKVRSNVKLLSEGTGTKATETQKKWSFLKGLAGSSKDEVRLMRRSFVSDVRVKPLVQTKWNQDYVYQDTSPYSTRLCYNYYTPNNYYCGCVAAAMAQLMFYHQYPTEGIGVNEFTITVDNLLLYVFTRGGDGDGGPYNWNDMVLDPNYDTPDAQRRAIGTLCYDAGVSAHISYGDSGSSAEVFLAKEALLNTFSYSNAIYGYGGGPNLGPGLIGMINPNLDAEMPVILTIQQDSGSSHAVICDGYGYNTSTMYHHINVGWGGSYDAWYNLPDVELKSNYEYNSVDKCIYNIFTTGTGEIISGRVTNSAGNPLDNCVVTAQQVNGATFTATTNAKGIYALVGVSSDSTYTISVTKPGHNFSTRTVITSKSEDRRAFSGNRWAVDFPNSPPGSVVYVDEDAVSGANDGSSWASAFADLQDALEVAAIYPNDVNEIWVAGGIYRPDRNTGFRSFSFQLVNGIGLYGGFAGNETGRQQRNTLINETILSGDINGDDGMNFTGRDENSFHVITGNGTDSTAIIDGFTIVGGNANGSYMEGYGAGIYIYRGSPTVNDCKFIDNNADDGGAGMYNSYCEPIVTNCTFIMNEARWGGGMYNGYNSNPTLTNCTFNGNSATSRGGGMYNGNNSNPTLTNCTFSENSTTYEGGGMENTGNSNPTLENCTFSDNSAEYGGGMHNYESSPTLTGCVFSENSAQWGGGMLSNIDSSPILVGCNFLNNEADDGGGGMCNWNSSNPEVIGCMFSGNSAADNGGGMYNNLCEPNLTNCTFNENSAQRGGGLYNDCYGCPLLTDCNFVNNSAEYGGGMENANNSSSTLKNCIFSSNEAEYGGGVYSNESDSTLLSCIFGNNSAGCGGGLFCDENSESVLTNCSIVENQVTSSGGGFYNSNESSATLVNCIVWNNASGQIVNDEGASAIITYSDVQDGWPGQGNIDNDPLFADPSNGDYHLKSRGGRWDPVSQSWVLDSVTSPCIDAGDPTTSFSLEPVLNGGRVNMGAYGGTTEASKRP